jgi:DNA-binding HxlR family transcriptional regulator
MDPACRTPNSVTLEPGPGEDHDNAPRVHRRPAIPATPHIKRHPYDQWAPDARALDIVGDKWTLLIVRDLAGGPRRFVELQRVLPGISTEQLRSRLNRMVADGLLTRKRYREVPPRVDYELTDRARDLMPVLGALARWGYAWAWGAPRAGEAIDIGAIFRLAAGLLEPPRSLKGKIEFKVTERAADSSTRCYALDVASGRAKMAECEAPEAESRVTGTEAAWVQALGPAASRDGLEFGGDRRLADAVLDGLGHAAAEARSAAA